MTIVYERRFTSYMGGQVIDYHDGVRKGFSISSAEPGSSCDGCSGC